MPAPIPTRQTNDIEFLAAKRLEYEKIALTQQAVFDLAHGRPNTSTIPSSTSSTALSASNITDPYDFLGACDGQLARMYEQSTEPTDSERQTLLDVAERALAVWHEYIMARESAETQIAVTRRYLELAREWSKTVGSSNNLAGFELRRYPLRRPHIPARPLSQSTMSYLRGDPHSLCAKAFLLFPNDAKRSGLWRIIGIQHGDAEFRGRPVHHGWAGWDAEVVYEVLFEECEQSVNVQSSVVWSLIKDSWYFDEKW